MISAARDIVPDQSILLRDGKSNVVVTASFAPDEKFFPTHWRIEWWGKDHDSVRYMIYEPDEPIEVIS